MTINSGGELKRSTPGSTSSVGVNSGGSTPSVKSGGQPLDKSVV